MNVTLAWLVLLSPFVALVLIALFTLRRPALSAGISVGACALSFVLALPLILGGLGSAHEGEPIAGSFSWIHIGDLHLGMGIHVDALTAVMLFVVTFVGLLIHIYSIGYMHGEKGFARYFACLSLFMFSMLGIVLADNFVMIFVFWELVGLSSYLLIGYYFDKVPAANAGKKAFLVNRVGDFGFVLGILILFFAAGTVDFTEIQEGLASGRLASAPLLAAALLVFMGALAKSAQFPLHVWLPDAMERPPPVSALIHAATMVAAGVYLLARNFTLFATVPQAAQVVAYIGGFTALFAATIAIVQNDIKRILAYSTLSQLGYMVMAIGLGSLTAGMFHLTTHAFFKALLFLGSGSVIHALHTQDIWDMGGLLKRMPITSWTFIIGSVALAGLPPFAGFFSKDEILVAAHNTPILYVLGTVTAFLTAFYVTRLVVVAFLGEPRKPIHAHESPRVMTIPLIILAIFSIFSGWIGAGAPTPFLFSAEKGFGSFVYAGEHPHVPEFHLGVMVFSTLVALAGVLLGYLIYGRKAIDPAGVRARVTPIYTLLVKKYYMDEIYGWLVAVVQQGWARLCAWFDANVLIRTIIDGITAATRWTGDKTRRLQTGQLQATLLIMGGGTVILILVILLRGA